MPRIAQSATSVSLLADKDRAAVTIHNDSTATLRVKFGGAAASLTDYRVSIPPGAYYESPFGRGASDGPVWGIWDAAGSGAAQVEEI